MGERRAADGRSGAGWADGPKGGGRGGGRRLGGREVGLAEGRVWSDGWLVEGGGRRLACDQSGFQFQQNQLRSELVV